MKTYNIAIIKANLSKIIREAIRGEEIVVTDHNKPVAKITGLGSHSPLPSHFDLETFLCIPTIRLKPGAISSSELIRKIRDDE